MSLLYWPGYILFFLMLFLPASEGPFKVVKAFFLAVVVATMALKMLFKLRLKLDRTLVSLTIISVCTGAVFMCLGAFRHAPGALRVGTIYVIWPFIYLLFVEGISCNAKSLTNFVRVMLVATLAIGLYGVSFVLHAAGWLPDYLYFEFYPDSRQGFYLGEGFLKASLRAAASLLYLVPFWVAALLTWPAKARTGISRLLMWVALFLGCIVVVLGARKALMLVVALSPLITLFFRFFLPKEIKALSSRLILKSLILITVFVISLYFYLHRVYGFELSIMGDYILTGFDFDQDPSASLRKEQFKSLVNDWFYSPLFGAGHGAASTNSLRSESDPWDYELSYLALLFHTGLVGFLLYSVGIFWLYWKGIQVIRAGNRLSLYMLATLVGTTCFLIANATNPYLEKYDYLWTIFFPLTIINIWLCSEKESAYMQSEIEFRRSLLEK